MGGKESYDILKNIEKTKQYLNPKTTNSAYQIKKDGKRLNKKIHISD
jgi:hypothetical protein